MRRRRSSRLTRDAAADLAASSTFAVILPLVLEAKEAARLSHHDKLNLRLVCKDIRNIVNPYVTRIRVYSTHVAYFKRSTFARSAKHIKAEAFTREELGLLSDTELSDLESAEITVLPDTMDLLARQKWPKLENLFLRVLHIEEGIRFDFSRLRRANWPLKTLKIQIELAVDGEEDEEEELSLLSSQISRAACLLRHFPLLQSLTIGNPVSIDNVNAFTRMRHSNLSSIELSCRWTGQTAALHNNLVSTPTIGAAISKSLWPNLQEIRLRDYDHFCESDAIDFISASWIKKLKVLEIGSASHLCSTGSEILFHGLCGGALESLTIEGTSNDALVHIFDHSFPKLKILKVRMCHTSGLENMVSLNTLLSRVFTADLPLLEGIELAYMVGGSRFSSYREPTVWDVSPDGSSPQRTNNDIIVPSDEAHINHHSNNQNNDTMYLPSLRHLKLSGVHIKPRCAAFLAHHFYSRTPSCNLDLEDCIIDSGADMVAILVMLEELELSLHDLDCELERLGLKKELYWFNLLSMDELKDIGLYLSVANIRQHINRVTNCSEKILDMCASKVSQLTAKERKTDKLSNEFFGTCSSIRNLGNVVIASATPLFNEMEGDGGVNTDTDDDAPGPSGRQMKKQKKTRRRTTQRK